MLTIWKYTLPLEPEFKFSMPIGAEILYVGEQRNVGCIWVAIDNEYVTQEDRSFRITGTGTKRPNPADYTYLGTYILDNGMFVWHLHEKLPEYVPPVEEPL